MGINTTSSEDSDVSSVKASSEVSLTSLGLTNTSPEKTGHLAAPATGNESDVGALSPDSWEPVEERRDQASLVAGEQVTTTTRTITRRLPKQNVESSPRARSQPRMKIKDKGKGAVSRRQVEAYVTRVRTPRSRQLVQLDDGEEHVARDLENSMSKILRVSV